jgi:hypothetical protein
MSMISSPSPHAAGVEWGGSGWGLLSPAPTPPTRFCGRIRAGALPTLGFAGGEGA